MIASVKDMHTCELAGVDYRFRTPSVYDPAKARRILTRERVRRPSSAEFRIAAFAGVEAVARAAGEIEEGARQRELMEDWYQLLEPVREDDIDEPDPMKRGEELLRLETERRERVAAIYPEVIAIEASLERHWPPYAELLADRNYWDDLSRIEIVRLLLVAIGGSPVALDEDKMMVPAAYQGIPAEHRIPLATFAFALLSPDETQRKN